MGVAGMNGGLLSHCSVFLNNLMEIFRFVTHAYQVVPATNSDMKEAAFRIRHKVYCSELNYENCNQAERESDGFDHHSTQIVLYSKIHKAYIGCVRLVHGHHEQKLKTLPFETHCKDHLNPKIINMVKQSGYRYAEVSRLAIERDFRNLGKGKEGKDDNKKAKSSSSALLSLYLGLHATAKQKKIRYLFAIVEPRLLKNLHRHNVPAIQIGRGVDHRGLRVPILIDVEDIERIIPTALMPVYNSIRNDVAKHMGTDVNEALMDEASLTPLPLQELLLEQSGNPL